jgi:hypothetical protein
VAADQVAGLVAEAVAEAVAEVDAAGLNTESDVVGTAVAAGEKDIYL